MTVPKHFNYLSMDSRILKRIAFDDMLNHCSCMSTVEYQRISLLEQKRMILITAKEIAYINFDWKESCVNLLLNKKTLSLIKVFRNSTMDPTHVLPSTRNDVIVYFKKDSSNIEFVFTNGGFKLKNVSFPFKIVDIALCPLAESKILMASDKSVFSYDYRKGELDPVFIADYELTSIEVKSKESTLRAFSSEKMLLIALEEKKLIKTVLLDNQTLRRGILDQNVDLPLITKEESKECNRNSFDSTENQLLYEVFPSRESMSTADTNANNSYIEADLDQLETCEISLGNGQHLEKKRDISWFSLRDDKCLFSLQQGGKFEISSGW